MNYRYGLVTISVRTDKLTSKMGKLRRTIAKAAKQEADELARQYSLGFKESIVQKRLLWTFNLYEALGSIRQYSGPGYETRTITIPAYGFAIDSMRPHVAPAYKPPLSLWIASRSDKFLISVRGARRAKVSGKKWLFVKPKPWIEYGKRKGRIRLEQIKEDGYIKRSVRHVGKS